jgi:hypothetical protein
MEPVAVGQAHSTKHHHYSRGAYARSQGSGSAVAVALFSMALTALACYWLKERTDKIELKVDNRLNEVKNDELAAEMHGMERTTALEGRLLKLEMSFKESVENERKGLESRLVDAQTKQEKALAPLGDIQADIAGLKGIVPSTQRHDQELIASAQKISELETRASTLESALVEMKKQLDAKPAPVAAAPAGGAGAGPGKPSPVGSPPWMGLVAQLESPQSGDRWVAVSSLGETKDPAVAEYLLPRLRDVDIFVRMATARVLGDLGSPKATGALIEALNDQDSSVREAAYVSLCAVSKKNLPFDAHQEPAERAKRVKAWQEWWKKAQEDGAAQ